MKDIHAIDYRDGKFRLFIGAGADDLTRYGWTLFGSCCLSTSWETEDRSAVEALLKLGYHITPQARIAMKNPHAQALARLGKGKPKTKTDAGHAQRKAALIKARAKLAALRAATAAFLLAFIPLAFADGEVELLKAQIIRVQTDGIVAWATPQRPPAGVEPFTGYVFITGHPKQMTFAQGDATMFIAIRNGVVRAGDVPIRAYVFKSEPEPVRARVKPAATPVPLGATGVATRKSERIR